MNTIKRRFGFLLVLGLITAGFTSCEEEEIAGAEVTVLQEYMATQGQLFQT